jgi:hypothetical protein
MGPASDTIGSPLSGSSTFPSKLSLPNRKGISVTNLGYPQISFPAAWASSVVTGRSMM